MNAAPKDEFAAHTFFTRFSTSVTRRYQKLLDDLVPLRTARWVGFFVSIAAYLLRTFFIHGFYIVTYALGIYLLNLLLAFLSPRIDPALEDNEDEDEPGLPSRTSDDFRPFIRRLPEFKFWLRSQQATMLGFCATFFEVFNVPVFWPILVIYFIVLFVLSMKKQIRHMIQYKYVPFSLGKPKHQGKADTGKVVQQ